MGYTTEFTGCIELSRPLTIAEAKTLLEINEDPSKAQIPAERDIDGYMQWVPTEDLGRIVWDQGEKFYDYTKWMTWLCGWLAERGIKANGEIAWQGEELGDTGIIYAKDNQVAIVNVVLHKTTKATPLTMGRLREIALEQLTKGGAA